MLLLKTLNSVQEDEEVQELATWVKRQRALWQAGHLIQDRTQILFALGFEIGTEAMVTPEWEYKFDQLVEWLLLMVSFSRAPLGILTKAWEQYCCTLSR